MAATLDDVLAELKNLVSGQNIANTVQQARQAMLNGGGGGFWSGTVAGRFASQSSLVQAGRAAAANAGRIMGGGGASGLDGLSAFGKVAGVASGMVSALNSFRKAVENTTQGQLDSYRRLAEASGGMAAVMAQRDFQEFLRSNRMGEAQAASAGRLAEAENRRKTAAEPFQNAMSDLTNDLLAGMNDLLADFYEWGTDRMNDLFEAIPDWIDGGFKIAKSAAVTDGALGEFAKGLEAKAKEIGDKAEQAMRDARQRAAQLRGRPAAPPGGLP